jgi:PAS domain S-box-containing protein
MTDGGAEPGRITNLRKYARARMEREVRNLREDLTPEETRKLVHELRTHQIELEIQNEELRRAQEELIESRDRYTDLYDFAPVGYATVGKKGLILEANLTLAKMVCISRPELLNMPFSTFMVREDQDTYYRHRQEVLESHGRGTCRLRMLRRDSEPFWVEMDTIPTEVEAGDKIDTRLRTAIMDITERKRAEEERLSLERQVQYAQKLESLGVLAGGIAHDFNNILMAILGNVNLALDGLSPTSLVRGNLLEIEKAVKRAADLARQMLAYAGRGRFVMERIDVGELVKEMAQLLEVSISKKVVLEENFAENLPAFHGDVTQIRQTIMNLITNASEAIGDRSGVIRLSTGAMYCDRAWLAGVNETLRAGLGEPLPEGVYTYIEVVDTGCGMDAVTLEKIFDPFFTTKFKGRGLGLSAVLGIVHGHKGAVKIRSAVGKGTTIRVLFPATERAEGSIAIQREDDESEGNDWRGSGTVLVVDDEEMVRAVSEPMLERMGFQVLTVPDGREALKAMGEHAGEIVCMLLDLTMPVMDGKETLRQMRRLRFDTPVILCSGYNEPEATRHFLGQGLAGFLQKPFDMATLRATLQKVLP